MIALPRQPRSIARCAGTGNRAPCHVYIMLDLTHPDGPPTGAKITSRAILAGLHHGRGRHTSGDTYYHWLSNSE
jgi:hypothetical protein